MSKTETALIVLVMLILAFGIWFIFSGAIWSFVSYFETLLYPELHTPK
ncbi:Ecr family regulatory small membrane protein [Pluralibacter gergoviae]|uniref:Ecr family regulatory small membrane protein n=1 Tax=Pluralibacter gergoviae TaxID=61647 RepID=A0AAW8HMS7_PLUGE|nr:Ecr family regulatory small membrane protein [Pluralibacter gergoviae]EKT9638545.1 Ecr family regulatory small membrane protein [Pluralibacter gergoviae]EKV3542427.1 Ecr family regulatory small membrane protein [Pluralibacter gergoviae]EKV9898971.1 Ecr family regulatory small membrane protein [Pluralibacter gergoviae]EKV9931171.1 Ecr family regulatory small membrane protein [Pluralibacter gergoviae]EKW6620078.1 Ecr family regulatory small membrane protein [Pluralibacter gergoviae]